MPTPQRRRRGAPDPLPCPSSPARAAWQVPAANSTMLPLGGTQRRRGPPPPCRVGKPSPPHSAPAGLDRKARSEMCQKALRLPSHIVPKDWQSYTPALCGGFAFCSFLCLFLRVEWSCDRLFSAGVGFSDNFLSGLYSSSAEQHHHQPRARSPLPRHHPHQHHHQRGSSPRPSRRAHCANGAGAVCGAAPSPAGGIDRFAT